MKRNIIRASSLFIASVVGAGFASGKEILNFFSKYQKESIYGLALAGILFFIFTYCLFNLIYMYKAKTESFSDIFPKGMGIFYNILSHCLLFCIYSVMIAGLSSWGKTIWGINEILSGMILTVIFAGFFLWGKTALINSSLVISPIMCTGILFVGIYYLLLSDKSVFNPFEKASYMWIISSVAYVSYNSVPLISLFWETKELFDSRRTCFISALSGCMSLTVISLVLDFLVREFFVKVRIMDIPMLYISESIGALADIISKVILFLAMTSTAMSTGFSLISITERKTGIRKSTAVSVVCVSGFILSVFGFSNLVEYIYPLFGYGGFMIIAYIMWLFISKCSITFDKNIK